MPRHHYPGWFTQSWPESRFNAMRHAGDPLADSTVEVLFKRGDREMVNQVLRHLHQPGEWPSDTPIELQAYLAASQTLPSWADMATLDRAYRFIDTHGVRYNIVLLFLSLPILYAWKIGGAQTLAMTGQLSEHFLRRVSETLRFVRDVIAEDGLGPQGRGIRTTQKVRLMHATIRHFAQSARCPGDKDYWNPQWGVPISQEALTATMLAFSTIAAGGLRKLNVPVTRQEESDLLHLWKVIGHVLGIVDANMPANVEEAHLLWNRFDDRNFGASQAGRLLTAAHLEFISKLAHGDALLHEALRGTDAALMRYLMGYRIAVTMLDVPRPGIWGLMITFTRLLFGLTERLVDASEPLQQWLDHNAEKLWAALQAFWNSQAAPRPFAVPSEQQAEQGLQEMCALNARDSHTAH